MRGLASVLAAAFLYNLAASATSNSLVLVIVSMGYGSLEVSYANMILNLFFILVSPLAGRIGDQLGARKPLLAVGLAIDALAALLLWLGSTKPQSLPTIYVASALAGVGGALFSANVTVLAVELGAPSARRPERVLSRLGFASGGGWASGLVLASLVSRAYSTPYNFTVSLALLVVGLAILVLGVPQPLLPLERLHAVKLRTPFYGFVDRVKMVYALIVEPPSLVIRVRRGLGDPLALFFLGVLVAFTGIGVFFTQVPVFMRKLLGMSDPDVFATLSVHSATSTLSFTIIHRLVEGLGAGRALTVALLMRSLAFALPPYAASISVHALPLVFLATGFTWSIISVSMNTLTVALSEEERRGERMGQLTSVTGIGLLAGSLVSGYIASGLGFTAVFVASSLLELAAALIVVQVARKART